LGQKKYIRDLSKGNQKKVGIVGTLISNTDLVILDEPFANLDPTTQIRLKALLKQEATNSGKTFLISSHDLQHLTEVCDRIVVLHKGEMVRDVTTTTATLQELEQFFQEQL
jgi:ABC-2 type transport system ATP-binding protein